MIESEEEREARAGKLLNKVLGLRLSDALSELQGTKEDEEIRLSLSMRLVHFITFAYAHAHPATAKGFLQICQESYGEFSKQEFDRMRAIEAEKKQRGAM